MQELSGEYFINTPPVGNIRTEEKAAELRRRVNEYVSPLRRREIKRPQAQTTKRPKGTP